MANTKIKDLTEKAVGAVTDEFPINDVASGDLDRKMGMDGLRIIKSQVTDTPWVAADITLASTDLTDTANIPLLNVANTFTNEQTITANLRMLGNNFAVQFGASADATIRFDGTRLVILDAVAGGIRVTKNGFNVDFPTLTGNRNVLVSGQAQIVNGDLASGAFANITGVGTITTGVWNGTVIDQAFLDANVVLNNQANTYTGAGTQDFAGATLDNVASLISNAPLPAFAGVVRMGVGERIRWNNVADNDGIDIITDSSDRILININSFNEFRLSATELDIFNNDLTIGTGEINVTSGALGDILKHTATGFQRFARGGADTVLQVNGAGTDLEYALLNNANLASGTFSNITGVGTIGTGTWEGTVVASAFLDADTAHLTTTQTFSGDKTFSGAVLVTAGTMRIPLSATPTMAVDGDFAIDTTITDFSMGLIKYFDGEEMAVVAMPVAQLSSPQDGDVVTYNASTDEFELRAP